MFRPGIDPVLLNITIAAIGLLLPDQPLHGAILFEREMMSDAALEARLSFNIDTILRLVEA